MVEGTTMTWCSNDCHQKPMWCGRRSCMSKAEYAQHMQNRRDKNTNKNTGEKDNKNVHVNDEFKVALAALTSPEDYAILNEQFFQVKD